MLSSLTYNDIDGHSLLIMGLSLTAFFLVTIVVVREILVRLPDGYFIETRCGLDSLKLHPLMGTTLYVLKNLLGLLVLIIGTIMLVVPGPGFVMIMIAIMLLDIPGKLPLLRYIIRQRHVFEAVNRLRVSRKRKPLLLPHENGAKS